MPDEVEKAWEQYGFLTKYKSKEGFLKDLKELKEYMATLSEEGKKEIQKAAMEFAKSLSPGYSLEERLKRQHKLLKLTKRMDKSLDEFIKEETKQLEEKII